MEKSEKKIGLLIFPNVISEQWDYSSPIAFESYPDLEEIFSFFQVGIIDFEYVFNSFEW